jgi:hypothetical protein
LYSFKISFSLIISIDTLIKPPKKKKEKRNQAFFSIKPLFFNI